MTLSGKGFDTNAYVTVGDKECLILSLKPSEIKCLAPEF